MRTDTTESWIRKLRAVAALNPVRGAQVADEAGNTRALDGLVVARLSGEPAPSIRADETPDERLWRSVVDNSIDPSPLLEEFRRMPRSDLDSGSLVPRALAPAVEVWTETEFASMHALAWLSISRSSPELLDRALDAARWHVTHTGPDNATNRPWAIHLFVLLSERDNAPEAALMAESLLHFCQISGGRPDRVSASILEDGADALERLAV